MSEPADTPIVVYRALAGGHAAEVQYLLGEHDLCPVVVHAGGSDRAARGTHVEIAVPPQQVARACRLLLAWERNNAGRVRQQSRRIRNHAIAYFGLCSVVAGVAAWALDLSFLLAFTLALGAGAQLGLGVLLVRNLYRAPRSAHYRAIPCDCGYDLRGNISGCCPECGTPIPSTVRRQLRRNRV